MAERVAVRFAPRLRERVVWRRRARVPFVRQNASTECGAACLAMVLRHFGRYVSLQECSARLGLGRDGASAGMLARAARQFGLQVRGYSIEPGHLRDLPLPLIAHWEFNHFVVVERCSPSGAELLDPAVGRRRVDAETLDRGLTGVVLAFAPGPTFERAQRSGPPAWRRYTTGLLRLPGVAPLMGQILLASLLMQLAGLAVPLATKLLVDLILPRGAGDAMLLLAASGAALVGAAATLAYLRAALLVELQARLDARLVVAFCEHLLALPLAFFQRRASGDLLMRLASNSLVRELVTNQSLSLLLDGGFALACLLALVWLSPVFAALTAGFALAQAALVLVSQRGLHELMQADVEADAAQQSAMLEALRGIGTLKASGSEERVHARWTRLFERHLAASLRRGRRSAQVEGALHGLRLLAPLALLWFGARQTLAGELSLGTMLAQSALAGSFLGPLGALLGTSRQLQTAGAHLERLGDVLERPREQDARGLVQLDPSGALEVERLSFRYDEHGPDVLHEISFRARPGEFVALVGPSGSGKSTLAALLLGLQRPSAGEVRYDGLPLERLDLVALRRRVGSVLQESYLFAGSLRSNVAFHDPAMPLRQVIEAAHVAALDEAVAAMPMAYETLIHEGGGALSGGERQRLALARAVAARPAVLVLDEATSHLDSATEARVAEELAALRSTRIVVAHRLASVRQADQILVFDAGRVVERGRHDELLARGGLYAALAAQQTTTGTAHRSDELQPYARVPSALETEG